MRGFFDIIPCFSCSPGLRSQVCLAAHKRLYGIGSGVLQQLRRGQPGYTMHQNRVPCPRHPTIGLSLRRLDSQKWPRILTFFWYLYISTAEILPTKFVMPSEEIQKRHDVAGTADDFDERYVQSFLKNIDAQFAMPSPDQLGPGSFAGPRRYLEHAQPIDLFYQYVVMEEADGRQPASLATFMKVFHQVFKMHLKFRDKKEHAECNLCGRFKQRIKSAVSKAQRTEHVRQYSAHLLAQWLDRQVYWKLRTLSLSFFRNDLGQTIQDSIYSSRLTEIVDGMDQSKLRCPRFGYDRLTKSLERLFRPTLHLTCAYIHGFKAFLPVTDENMRKDSTTQAEVIIRSLSALCDSLGGSNLPLGYHLQQDNCYREGKNQFVINLLLLLQLIGAFRWTACGYLRTGHSHEDVDMVFGQISRLLRGKKFETPDDLISLLKRTVESRDSRNSNADKPSHLQGAGATPYKLDQCAYWKVFVQQVGVHWKGLRPSSLFCLLVLFCSFLPSCCFHIPLLLSLTGILKNHV